MFEFQTRACTRSRTRVAWVTMKKKTLGVIALSVVGLFGLGGTLTACESDSTVASRNISTEAEQFRIQREIVLYNGITDKYIAVVVGRCSVDSAGDGLPGGTLAVTCKIGSNKFIKNYLGKSDNVTWFSLQQKAVSVDVYHTEVVFKPANILPYVNIETGNNGATGNDGDTGSEFTQTVTPPTDTTTDTVPSPVVPGKTGK